MSKLREIKLEVSDNLFNELEIISKNLDKSCNEIVNDALKQYFSSVNKLKNGYKSMGKVNKEYAEMCLNADNEALSVWEEKLSESEKGEC